MEMPVAPSGLQRRVISVGRALSSFALEAAAVMNDGAVESVLYLDTNEDVKAMTQRLKRPDITALRLTVIPVAKRIGDVPAATTGGGEVLDGEEGNDSSVSPVSAPWRTTSGDTSVASFHDAGDEWAMNQPSPPPAPPPQPPPPPPTPRTGYVGVMSSSIDYDACAMVVTPDSGTDQTRDGTPEVDFCRDYGQIVLVRIGGGGGDDGDDDVDVDGVLRGMKATIRLGLTRAVVFETSGADRTLSGAAKHFRGAPYDVYWVGRYDALRTAGTAGTRTKDQPSLVRIDGEYYRPLLEEFLPANTVKTVLAVRRDDEFAASALRYGLTVCDTSCGCKVPEDKPCGEATTTTNATGGTTGAAASTVTDDSGSGSGGSAAPRRDGGGGRDAKETREMKADADAAAKVAAAAEKGAAAALASADRASGVLDTRRPSTEISAEEELRAGALLEDDPVKRENELKAAGEEAAARQQRKKSTLKKKKKKTGPAPAPAPPAASFAAGGKEGGIGIGGMGGKKKKRGGVKKRGF